MARPQACLTRTPTNDELHELRRRVAARGISRRDHQRAAMVLAVINGTSLAAAGRNAGCCENTAALWCRRFHAHGLEGLVDRPKSGAPVWYGPTDRPRVLEIGRTPAIARQCSRSPSGSRSCSSTRRPAEALRRRRSARRTACARRQWPARARHVPQCAAPCV
jgi:transposase